MLALRPLLAWKVDVGIAEVLLSAEHCVRGAPLLHRKHPRPFATAARWWPPRPQYPFEEGIGLIAQGVGWVDPEADAFVRLMAGSRVLPPLADPPPTLHSAANEATASL